MEEKATTSTVDKIAEVGDLPNACPTIALLTVGQANVAEVKVVKGSEAYHEAIIKEKPSFSDAITWRLIGCLLLGCFCQTMNGFDGSLFGGAVTLALLFAQRN